MEKSSTQEGLSSIYVKDKKIFIIVSAKPGSKFDGITAVEDDYVGVSI